MPFDHTNPEIRDIMMQARAARSREMRRLMGLLFTRRPRATSSVAVDG